MASASKAAVPADTKPTKASSFADFKPPTDMDRVDQPSLDGWYKAETGNGFYGRLVGHFQIADKKNNKMRDVVILQLLVDCEGIGSQSNVKETLKKGQMLGVSISHKLAPILEYVTNHGTAYARAIEKVNIGNGQSMWNFELRCSGTKAAPPAARQMTKAQASGSEGDDEIPF